jgi:hypothetical protein
MKRIGGVLVRGPVLWTVFLFGLAILLVGQAILSIYSAQQVCFMNYPSVACPTNDDPAFVRLRFAFFGVPVLWLIGIGLIVLRRALLSHSSLLRR